MWRCNGQNSRTMIIHFISSFSHICIVFRLPLGPGILVAIYSLSQTTREIPWPIQKMFSVLIVRLGFWSPNKISCSTMQHAQQTLRMSGWVDFAPGGTTLAALQLPHELQGTTEYLPKGRHVPFEACSPWSAFCPPARLPKHRM
jgi:hypothetical protein